jgi:hypothetical protein
MVLENGSCGKNTGSALDEMINVYLVQVPLRGMIQAGCQQQ